MMILKEIEMITKDVILLFNNQRNIEKCQILAYKTYQISAIEELDIHPKEMLSQKQYLLGNDLFSPCITLTGYVNPCA